MRRSMLVLLSLLASTAALAQFPLPRRPRIEIPIEIPGLEKILQEEPRLTTSFEDARTAVPFLDDFEPRVYQRMARLPRGPSGGFLLVRPGVFKFSARSYCLHAGRYGPSAGDGYLYAPLKGRWASIIQNVLGNSVQHAEIAQRDIQTLLWALLARTRIADCAPEVQNVARLLLTPKELRTVNGGALGLIPDELKERLFGNLPPLVRQALEAEAELRRMLTQATPSFEELEQVAVLTREVPLAEDEIIVPLGRWSYHPDGLFVRYFPSGYSTTLRHVSVPQRFEIERDELGRIILLRDQFGNRIETEYDDTVEPLTIAVDGRVRGYAFRSIRFADQTATLPAKFFELTQEWNDVGWTLVGVPSGRGRVVNAPARFTNAQERYQWATTHRQEVYQLKAELDRLRRASRSQPGEMRVEDIIDLGHYAKALEEAIGKEHEGDMVWVADHLDLVKIAWQYAVCSYAGAQTVARSPAMPSGGVIGTWAGLPVRFAADGGNGGDDGGDSGHGSSGGSAYPGAPGSQRLGQSDDPSDEEEDDDEDPCEEVMNYIKENSMPLLEHYFNNQPQPGESGEDYEKRIPGGAEFGVTMDCELVKVNPDGSRQPATLQDFIDYYKAAGYSDAAAQAIGTVVYLHEMQHVGQCKLDPENFRDDSGADRRRREMHAYCLEIVALLLWLEDNCGTGPEWEDMKQKVEAMCG